MNTYSRRSSFFAIASGAAVVLCRICSPAVAAQSSPTNRPHAYHANPPTGPLPVTIDPSELRGNRKAFVIYSVAAQIRELMYQVPCYCGCDEIRGHESLLDCFTTRHGITCGLCQKEALFCYLERTAKTPAEIREALATGKANVDLESFVDDFPEQTNLR